MADIRRFLLYAFLVFIIISLIKNIIDYRNKYNFYLGYKQDFEEETKKNIEYKTEYLKKTDPKELEKTIRNRLNLSKPGEMVVIIPQLTPTPTVITPTPAPNWQQWTNLYFK